MAKKNTLVTKESKDASRSTKRTKRAKKASSFKLPDLSAYFKFLKDEKFQKTVGLIVILLSIYCFIAFISYLFTWKVDQDKVDGLGLFEFLFKEGDFSIANWLGRLGAILSHKLIHNWFGIAVFIVVLNFFVLGFKLLTKISLLPLWRMVKYSFLGVFWMSLFFGFFFGTPKYLGGLYGYYMTDWLNQSVGSIGTGILILFSCFLFIVLKFNPSFAFLGKMFEEKKENQEEIIPDTSVVNTIKEEEIVEDEVSEEIDLSEQEEQEEEEKEEEESELELEPEAEEEVEKEVEEPEISSDDDFEVEVAKEEDVNLSEEELNEKVKEFGEYDPTLDLSSYQLPSVDLLEEYGDGKISVDKEELETNKNRIVETLSHYNIKVSKIKATIGPTVTLYEIVPAPGVRISKIKNLEDDIALSLAALGIRIIAPIPGKGTIGIEVPNSNPDIVSMRSLIASDKFQNSKMELPIAIGKTISNETFITDLTKMPHLLMAGATGQGKSVGLNAILVSILYKKHPSQVKFVLVDPKKVELTLFNKIERHFLAKLPDTEEAIITDTSKVVNTVNSLCIEMDQRYDLLKDAQVRNIKEYNAKFVARKLNPENGHRFLPYIVLVIDEFADLIMTAGKEIETPIARLAQLARAIGIHLIVATQRPSVNVITGIIKANFPARIAFRVTSKIDSRTILDAGGADQLIGRGDLLLSLGSEAVRIQCGFVDTPEVEKITEFIGSQRAYPSAFILPEYVGPDSDGGGGLDIDDELDEKFEDAARIVVQTQQGSASMLQRKLKLGYNRAGRIVDQLEAAGIIGPFEGSKARKVLIPDEISLEQFLDNMKNN